MKIQYLAAASAIALAGVSASASAQHHHMPGMAMPQKPKAAGKHKPAATKAAPAKKPVTKKKSAKPASADPTRAQTADSPEGAMTVDPTTMDHSQMGHEAPPATPAPTPPPSAPLDHGTMDHGQMDHSQMDHGPMDDGQMDHQAMGHTGSSHASMTGALGPHPMTRESSGTAWQPDNSAHSGLMVASGDWHLMAHGNLDFVYDWQGGRRGDTKLYPAGMIMGLAQRPLGTGVLQFRAMFSPDPIMGRRGYPLLLASGETADGVTHLVDRQHPHDLFMELSASVSQDIGRKSSLFLYGGLPGEPAFGPPAFMHREAIMQSPEAPISHHWLDSTHISFGVLTAGVVADQVKLEVSRFNAREPDQRRWNLETGPLDSTAVRVSWNPTPSLSLQGSWGDFRHPEQLEPEVNEKRLSASLLYSRPIAPGWKFAGTLAWGRKSAEGHSDDAFAAEAALMHRAWTFFGRGEMTENRELLEVEDDHGLAYRVGKISVGAVRDFQVAPHVALGLGALAAVNFVPGALREDYGSRHPIGAMGFVRLKLN